MPSPRPPLRLLRLRPIGSRPLRGSLGLRARQHVLPDRARVCRRGLRLRRRFLGRRELRRVERRQAGAGRAGDPQHSLWEGAAGPGVQHRVSNGGGGAAAGCEWERERWGREWRWRRWK